METMGRFVSGCHIQIRSSTNIKSPDEGRRDMWRSVDYTPLSRTQGRYVSRCVLYNNTASRSTHWLTHGSKYSGTNVLSAKIRSPSLTHIKFKKNWELLSNSIQNYYRVIIKSLTLLLLLPTL